MEKPGDESAGAGERVENVDAFVGDRDAVEVGVEEIVDRAIDEIDDLDGGVHDAERLDGLGEGLPEELLVELGDDVLSIPAMRPRMCS